jgi:hypothetical protein
MVFLGSNSLDLGMFLQNLSLASALLNLGMIANLVMIGKRRKERCKKAL